MLSAGNLYFLTVAMLVLAAVFAARDLAVPAVLAFAVAVACGVIRG